MNDNLVFLIAFIWAIVYLFKFAVDLAMEKFEAKMKNLMQVHFENLNEEMEKIVLKTIKVFRK